MCSQALHANKLLLTGDADQCRAWAKRSRFCRVPYTRKNHYIAQAVIEAFRIEHRVTHIGPFQTPDPYLQELATKAGSVSYLKNPYDDGLGLAWIPWTFVFGSPSLDTLKRWVFLGGTFDSNEAIVRELKARDFVVAEYLVEEGSFRSSFSGLQLAFDARTAREDGLVQYHDMTVLLARSPLVFCLSERIPEAV